MGTRRELNALLQRHGLFIDKPAMALLQAHVEQAADLKAEVATILHRVKNNAALSKNRVTKEIMEDAIAVEGDGEMDAGENIVFIDTASVPLTTYDAVRNVMVRRAGREKGEPISRIQAFRERFELVEQRVLNNPVFAQKNFVFDEAASARPTLTRISSIRRAEGVICILGLLTQPQEGKFYLEDLSGRVEVDITTAESLAGLYTENCIIIVEGSFKDDVFVADSIAMPPAEDRQTTCTRFPALAVPTNRKPYTPEEFAELQHEESKQVDTQVVVLSDVWLDRPRVMGGLKKLFGRFDIACKNAEEGDGIFFLFVLMGNFVSQQTASGVTAHQEGFDKLAAMLESFDALLPKACFVIVPGPNDVIAGNPLVLPRNPLPDVIARGFKGKIPACTFATDPCRIKFYTQELVFHRDDVCVKMRKYSRKPAEGRTVQDHAARTLLCQGHLAPLPLQAAPIDWAHDHALRLYPLPSLLVLGDRVSTYSFSVNNAKITNPGCFADDFSFALYSPVGRSVEVLYIDQVDDIPEQERRAAERAASKKKSKRRTETKAAREGRVEHESFGAEPRATDTKTPKTRKKVPKDHHGAGGLNEKGAITTFFSRRAAPEEGEQMGGAGRRRLRQHDSDESGSGQSETEESGNEGSGESSGGEEAGEDGAGKDALESDEEDAQLRRRAPTGRPKRNLAASDDEEEAASMEASKVKAARVIQKATSDDADDFAYVPSARVSAYVSH